MQNKELFQLLSNACLDNEASLKNWLYPKNVPEEFSFSFPLYTKNIRKVTNLYLSYKAESWSQAQGRSSNHVGLPNMLPKTR